MRRSFSVLKRVSPIPAWRIKALAWFRVRTQRERILVLGAAVMLLFTGLYVGIWQPLSAMRTSALADIARYETIIARLQTIEPNAVELTTRQVAPATTITTSAGELGLAIQRLEPEGGRIRVALEEASFEEVIVWLDTLESDHSQRIVSLEIDRRPAPGVVSTRVMLED